MSILKDIFIPILDTDHLGRTPRLKELQWYRVEKMEHPILKGTSTKTSLSWLPRNKSFLKLFFLLCGISALVFCAFYLQRTSLIDKGNIISYDRSPSLHRATNQTNSSLPKEKEEKSPRRPGKKILIAFDYWEQLTMATNSFLGLTALTAYGGRQVVVPFVKNSRFLGAPTQTGFAETLALYYNVSALNRTLRSRGHGTLISWNEFQDVCSGKLDILVHLDYTDLTKSKKYNRTTQAFFPCNARQGNILENLKAERTICMNVFAVDSVEKFENDVIGRLPCVGLDVWKGTNNIRSYRAQFNLRAVVPDLMQFSDAATFFSSRLLQVARHFIAKSLGPLFVSVHIRAESMLYIGIAFKAVKECISNLTSQVQRYNNASRTPIPLFLATDFAGYGSLSQLAILARKNAKSLMSILAPLKPITFQPSTYSLTDHGAVAIVEMNIVSSGKRLFVVGGGSFQQWIVNIFLNKANMDQQAKPKCQIRNCVRECVD